MTPRREAWRGNISSNYHRYRWDKITAAQPTKAANYQRQTVYVSVRTYPSDMNWGYLTERLSLLGAVI